MRLALSEANAQFGWPSDGSPASAPAPNADCLRKYRRLSPGVAAERLGRGIVSAGRIVQTAEMTTFSTPTGQGGSGGPVIDSAGRIVSLAIAHALDDEVAPQRLTVRDFAPVSLPDFTGPSIDAIQDIIDRANAAN